MARRRSSRKVGFLALYLGLAVYGTWSGLIFIAWMGSAFAVAELQPNDRHRAVIASVAFSLVD